MVIRYPKRREGLGINNLRRSGLTCWQQVSWIGIGVFHDLIILILSTFCGLPYGIAARVG
jgi:hypothetical protein